MQASAVIGDPVKQEATPAPTSQRAAAQRRRAAVARLLRMGVSDGATSSGDTAATSDLETELALLREENAQLKVERHRPADAGHVIERMRSLRPQSTDRQAGESAQVADATQAITECMAVRDGLMQACQEVQQAMQGIRGRLGALAGDIHSRPGETVTSGRLAATTAEAADGASVGDETPSELVQSVA
ncbi:MAG TPA: hypothetical protein VK781_01685 [Solirubrobacteraceae bacterium]|nr:hypothetical protein [Solirubrobacteraceae bacterium]